MRQKLRSITQSLHLPSICALCKHVHKGRLAFCSFCTQLIPRLGSCCKQCAHPLPTESHPFCGACIKNPPAFNQSYIPYSFEEPLRRVLHDFKYNRGLYLGPLISHFMMQKPPQFDLKTTCLIPVPIHPQRLKQRGYNQAAVLAKLLAKELSLAYDFDSCKKTINTAAQASLDRQARQSNLRKAFQAKPIPYPHVLLIDDLMTTGNTANELALTLKKAGVDRIDVWCCARTI